MGCQGDGEGSAGNRELLRSEDSGSSVSGHGLDLYIHSFTLSLIYSSFLPTNIYGAFNRGQALGTQSQAKIDIAPTFL